MKWTKVEDDPAGGYIAFGRDARSYYVAAGLRKGWIVRMVGMERSFATLQECRAYAEGCEATAAGYEARNSAVREITERGES